MSAQSFYKLGVMTYFQINRDFIAEVLCINKEKPATSCNGQCFLKQKLQLADDAPEAPTPAPAGKQSIDFPTFIVSENYYGFQRVPLPVSQNTSYVGNTSSPHVRSQFHPPTSI
jgi:hypothetical protein